MEQLKGVLVVVLGVAVVAVLAIKQALETYMAGGASFAEAIGVILLAGVAAGLAAAVVKLIP